MRKEALRWTGGRISEVLALTPTAIDIESGVASIRTLKRRKLGVIRQVPLPGDLIKDLSGEVKLALEGRLKAWIDKRTAAGPPVKLGTEKLHLLVESVRAKAQEQHLSTDETEKLCSELSKLFPA